MPRDTSRDLGVLRDRERPRVRAQQPRGLRLSRADAGWAGIEFYRSCRLQLLAVEAERHDLFLDHALHQQRAIALAPGEPLTPVANLGLGQRKQLAILDAENLHQSVVVEEGAVLGLVGA